MFDEESGIMIVDCNEKADYQDFFLTIDGNQFTILAEDYWYEVEAENYWEESSCFLGIIQDKTINYWIMGDVFLRGYYTIHNNIDHADAYLGFAPHATSTKSKVTAVTLPETNVEEVTWELTWVFDAYFFNVWGILEPNFKQAA